MKAKKPKKSEKLKLSIVHPGYINFDDLAQMLNQEFNVPYLPAGTVVARVVRRRGKDPVFTLSIGRRDVEFDHLGILSAGTLIA
jgi:hypothetical protein